MNQIIDWQPLVDIVRVLCRSGIQKGGRSVDNMLVMAKSMFLQHFYELSDPQLEELLKDRLSFQQFVGLSLADKAPDFTSFWNFKIEPAIGPLLREVCPWKAKKPWNARNRLRKSVRIDFKGDIFNRSIEKFLKIDPTFIQTKPIGF